VVAKYLYKRGNSPHYWFELKIPQDVQGKLGISRVRRSTRTDSLRKATRIANIWAETVWADIEAARGNDWDLHVVKSGLKDLQDRGLTHEEIDDIALDVLSDNDSRYQAYERASNKVVVLVDHLEGYLKWCDDKGNSPKTLRAKRIMLGQFVEKFRQLDDVTEYNIRRWASERDIKGATQRSVKSFCTDFFRYLGQEVLFKTLDASVFDGLTTKAVNNKHKEVLSGKAFKKLLQKNSNDQPAYKDAIMLLAYTGRRSVAIANLECDDVVTINDVKCFRIRTDKDLRPGTHKPHIVPIHPRLHAIVDRLISDSQDGFLLPLRGDTPERRSEALQGLVNRSGEVTSHQFRTSVITMLHNSPEELPDKAIYSVVGHSLGKDAHMKSYMAGLKPEALVKTVEAINWDHWEWH
jgi:integrase